MDFRTAISEVDIREWLQEKSPGYLIRRFVAHLDRDEQDANTPVTLKSREERKRLRAIRVPFVCSR